MVSLLLLLVELYYALELEPAGAVFGAALCRRLFAACFSALAVDEGAMVGVFYGGSLLLP